MATDAKTLAERLRKNRRLTASFKHMKFFARRPTDYEVGRLGILNARVGEMAREFVDGWEGVRVCDLFPGETNEEPIDFDRELWLEYSADNPDLMRAVGEPILQAYINHAKQQSEAEKNSAAGLSDVP